MAKLGQNRGQITALLGPTNTGKTYFAVERMLTHQSGVIGFPLRLLARENYDRVGAIVGKSRVALITGEEKIIPQGAQYYFCTVESMPVSQSFDFLGIDEIQLCADPERGHVFTDRLLRARGVQETMFMGAETMRPVIAALIPEARFESRPRLSNLTYTGFKKITRLERRSAVVAFSIDDVYWIADLIKRQRGGTAVVLGALSPRTRNAQVEMYQSGEVEFMVATDAIGMGLNMDIHHVALAATRKFDGRQPRNLTRAELAQIAGRAGRHMKDGTFGVSGKARDLDEETVEAIQNHVFPPIEQIVWRNHDLDFHSPKALIKSLERGPGHELLIKGRPSDDYLTLSDLSNRDAVAARASDPGMMRLLWDVCQIPDFRKTLSDTHYDLVEEVFIRLAEDLDAGGLSEEWMESHIARLDTIEGDVDTLMTRLAHIRTWTYITHHHDWLKNPGHWQARALSIEDRLSDALHEALTRRFVDRRSAVIMARVEEGVPLLAGIKKDGEVVVEGHKVGELRGFRFIPDKSSGREEGKAIMSAARAALRPEITRRKAMLLKSEDKQFKLEPDGQIFFQPDPTNPLPGVAIGRVKKGEALLKPQAQLADSDLFEGQDKADITGKLQQWLEKSIHFALEPLFRLVAGDDLTPAARGIAFQIQESLGIVPRDQLEEMIATLDEEGRKALRARKVRMGPIIVYMPELNKPAAIRLRALLLTLWNDGALPVQTPPDGMVSLSVADKNIDKEFYSKIGYPVYGPRAIRVDMLDRVICAIYDNADKGVFQAQHQMAEWLGSNITDLYAVLEAMGHTKIKDPIEEQVKAEEAAVPSEEPKAEEEKPAEEKAAASPEEKAEEKPAEKKEQVKPELATFRLKRGKASAEKKPYPKKDNKKEEGGEKKKFRSKDKKPGGKKPDGKSKDNRERVYSANAQNNPDDNPFAILQQLKTGNEKK